MSAAVEIQGLCKRFGTFTAVDHISFSVDRGEILGFLGPNGAGKSTTMKMVTGFLAPTAGRVSICGFDVATQPLETKRRIGYLPEGAPLYGDMTPLGMLRFVAEVRGIPAAQRAARIDDAIARVQLAEVLEVPIETLSKGFKRRVGLAQAILHDPEVLVLDEPTDGLDPNQKHEVRTLIRAMARDKVIILSTHILEEVHAVCSRAIIIARGRLVADGTPADLEARSQWHNAVSVKLRGAGADKALAALGWSEGVRRVERLAGDGDAAVAAVLFPEAGRSIAAAVARAARDSGAEVDELHVEQGRLDEVFRTLTTGEVAAAEADAAPAAPSAAPPAAAAPAGRSAKPRKGGRR